MEWILKKTSKMGKITIVGDNLWDKDECCAQKDVFVLDNTGFDNFCTIK